MAEAPTYTYFAYGSNMSSERLRQRTPSAKPFGRARLRAHRLRWHKRGRDGSGKCDAAFTGRREDAVWGVLYAIDSAEKRLLDAAEGLGVGYGEKDVQVVAADGAVVVARTYEAKPAMRDGALLPLPAYKRRVLAGAREHGLPKDYVAALEKVETSEA